MADAAPRFALYVSSVEGRVASRPGSPHAYIGCRLRTPEEVKAGITDPTWQPEQIIPVLASEYDACRRDWDSLVRDGDLRARTEDDWKAYQESLAKAEEKRAAELKAAEEKAKKAEKKAEAEKPAAGGSQ